METEAAMATFNFLGLCDAAGCHFYARSDRRFVHATGAFQLYLKPVVSVAKDIFIKSYLGGGHAFGVFEALTAVTRMPHDDVQVSV